MLSVVQLHLQNIFGSPAGCYAAKIEYKQSAMHLQKVLKVIYYGDKRILLP